MVLRNEIDNSYLSASFLFMEYNNTRTPTLFPFFTSTHGCGCVVDL